MKTGNSCTIIRTAVEPGIKISNSLKMAATVKAKARRSKEMRKARTTTMARTASSNITKTTSETTCGRTTDCFHLVVFFSGLGELHRLASSVAEAMMRVAS